MNIHINIDLILPYIYRNMINIKNINTTYYTEMLRYLFD